MTRPIRVFVLLFVLGFTGFQLAAQVQTGTPPYGSFAGAPDIVDLANLNVHLSVPVINKPGRGTNFTYDLSYDSSVWSPTSSSGSHSWTPVYNWGWRGQTEIATGYFSYYLTIYDCTYYIGKVQYQGYEEDTYSNFVYHDPWGVSHPFTGATNVYIGTSQGSCKIGTNRSLTAVATDGSGLTINANASTSIFTVTLTNGKVISPPLGNGVGAAQATDRNGNIISVNSTGQYFDTLSSSTPVLTVSGSGTPASPETFTYTPPSGTNVSYSMKYAAYTVQTKFGCSGVTEYGPTSTNLVSEIDLPDGSKYTLAYETTPGVPANVTGRLASVTLPTGGISNINIPAGAVEISLARMEVLLD